MFSFVMSLIFSGVAAALLTLASIKILQILQLSGYKPKGIFAWLKRTKFDYLKRFFCLAFFSFATAFLFIMSFPNYYIRYIGFAFFIALMIFFIVLEKKQKQKTRLVYTNRIKRLLVIIPILYAAISFVLIYFAFDIARIEFSLIAISPLLIPFIPILAHFIIYPIEVLIGKMHFNRAKKKLDNAKHLIRIGISGSYGKTTTKNILAVLLGEKYRVLSTPKSVNTPMGLSKIINEHDLTKFDVFIAEMGAKRVGETEELCEFIAPRFGIVTKTGPQHLETFLTLDNAVDTEFSLASRVGELVVLNIDDEHVAKRADGIDKDRAVFLGVDATYENVRIGEDGTQFDFKMGDESVEIKVQLLGRHIPEVFCQAALLASKMGVGFDEIARLAGDIKPVKHRLELIKTANGVVLDDAYNSNPEGAKNALEVLGCFEGTKVLISPGFIELGVIESEENFKLGQAAAALVDYLIVVKNEDIFKGAIEGGMSEDRVMVVPSLDAALEALKKLGLEKQAVLFLNDLPDNY